MDRGNIGDATLSCQLKRKTNFLFLSRRIIHSLATESTLEFHHNPQEKNLKAELKALKEGKIKIEKRIATLEKGKKIRNSKKLIKNEDCNRI